MHCFVEFLLKVLQSFNFLMNGLLLFTHGLLELLAVASPLAFRCQLTANGDER